ncbi:unnamed protein product [Musa banksii]
MLAFWSARVMLCFFCQLRVNSGFAMDGSRAVCQKIRGWVADLDSVHQVSDEMGEKTMGCMEDRSASSRSE